MFEDLLGKIVGAPLNSSQRADGAAFLKVARDLYGLSGLDYLGLNIPVPSGTQRYAHCSYSDTSVKHCFSAEAVSVEPLIAAGLAHGPQNWEPGKPEWLAGESLEDPETHAMTFPLPASWRAGHLRHHDGVGRLRLASEEEPDHAGGAHSRRVSA
jgi:hypothetical protein